MKYFPHIDGLRAVAILPVVLYHAGLGCRGGFVGVDVFFVISGYLISGLILKDLEAGKFSIVEFWERRIRRILPPLFVVVFAALAAGYFLYLPADLKELGESAVAQALLISNVYFWQASGYFAPAAEVKPLLHTWSLAVEEQFYLLFPFLLMALRRLPRPRLAETLALLGLCSLGLSIDQSNRYPAAGFYLLPSRAWELTIGALLAVAPSRECRRWFREILSWAGLLAIAGAVFWYDSETRFPGLAALLPCGGAGAVIYANAGGLSSAGRLLALRPLVFLGLISYSLYLWHWPVLVFARYWTLGPMKPPVTAALLLAVFVLAVLSWRFVERPFRRRVLLPRRRRLFACAALAGIVSLCAGSAMVRWKGWPSRIPAPARDYLAASMDRAFTHELSVADARAGRFVKLGDENSAARPRVFVWGDSHAMAVMPVLDRLCRDYRVRGLAATHSSTAPLLGFESAGVFSLRGDSMAFNEATAEFIERAHPSDVILAASWVGYDTQPERFRDGLRETVARIHAASARAWIMKQVPMQQFDVPKALAGSVLFGWDAAQLGLPADKQRKKLRRQDRFFDKLDPALVTILDPSALLRGGDGRSRLEENGRALYRDQHHLTTPGALALRPLFEPIFQVLAETAAHR